MYILDTDVTVHLRDRTAGIVPRLASLLARPKISLLTWVELEGGVHKVANLSSQRRQAVDSVLRMLTILPVEASTVRAYSEIVAARGFSRPRIIDRLIAATAIVNDLTLITMNGDDFRDIPDLRLEIWPLPGQ